MKGKDILTKVINQLGISPAEFQSSLNISTRSTRVNDVLSGKVVKISASFADIIRQTYPQFNRKYLIAGIGPMLNGEEEVLPDEGMSPVEVLNTIMYVYGIPNLKQLSETIQVNRSWGTQICREDVRPYSISQSKAQAIRKYIDDKISDKWLRTGKGHMYSDGRPDPYDAMNMAKQDTAINDLESPIHDDIAGAINSSPVSEKSIEKLYETLLATVEKIENRNDARYQEIMDILNRNGYSLPHHDVNYAAEDLTKD